MKASHQVFVGAIVLIIIGFGLILGGLAIQIPSAYNTFLGIPYAVNPEFVSSFNEKIGLLMFGFLFLGFGFGVLGTIGFILRLERNLSRIPPPPPQT